MGSCSKGFGTGGGLSALLEFVSVDNVEDVLDDDELLVAPFPSDEGGRFSSSSVEGASFSSPQCKSVDSKSEYSILFGGRFKTCTLFKETESKKYSC